MFVISILYDCQIFFYRDAVSGFAAHLEEARVYPTLFHATADLSLQVFPMLPEEVRTSCRILDLG